jgi:hypothetical protein
MEFEHAAIALLASMVLVLAGMVGWLYWQQTRMFQNMNNIVMVVGELASRPTAALPEPEDEAEVEVAPAPAPSPAEEDDRVSVEQAPADVVEGPTDVDGLEGKTKAQLREMLTKKGMPFGKNDGKGVLISLLKATA